MLAPAWSNCEANDVTHDDAEQAVNDLINRLTDVTIELMKLEASLKASHENAG
ncbi:MAG: hypothetical protein HC888_06755 [Candidatus Competibacteraceae bacterium]|nr:hypothetical protein [Candidatus Competibacteraceae bacterium]